MRAGLPCTNCGESGHQQRYCVAPVSSYGIILFRIKDQKWNPIERLAIKEVSSTVIPINDVEFGLIQRKDSIGFIELVRGKYKLTDMDYIRDQIAGMTQKERDIVANNPFEALWNKVWGEENKNYKHDFETSKEKFHQLQKGIVCPKTQETIKLSELFNTIPCQWNTPEWGFPKGRRNRYESDYECAIRETCEETGLNRNDFQILQNLKPIRETFFGNNNIYYTHIYYLGWCPHSTELRMKDDSEIMRQEIGDIGWFGLEECIQKIRPTNIEKREILLQASRILKNTCPILFHPSIFPTTNPVIRQNERDTSYGFVEDESRWSTVARKEDTL